MLFRFCVALPFIATTSPAFADVTYTSQTRYVTARALTHTERADAPDFSRFNERLTVNEVNTFGFPSTGYGVQDSSLGAAGVQAQCQAIAITQGQATSAAGQSVLVAEFNLASGSPYVLSGFFSTGGGPPAPAVGFLTLNGPAGTVFNIPSPLVNLNFSGSNAITGFLSDGHYRLEANLSASGGTGVNHSLILDFTLTIPTPAPLALGLLVLPLTVPRRRAR